MTPARLTPKTAHPSDLRDRALNLRESVNSARARLSAQRDRIERLRAEMAALRALAAFRPAAPPAAGTPAPAARTRTAPLSRDAAMDSAPATASLETGAGRLRRAAPYALILAAAIALQLRPSGRARAGVPLSAAVPAAPRALPAGPASPLPEADGADEALLLVHEWKVPGDARPLSERLTPGGLPPGARPEWNAERTGERTYRVSFRASDAEPSYEFDVDLDARRVDPTPETAELITPRLAASR